MNTKIPFGIQELDVVSCTDSHIVMYEEYTPHAHRWPPSQFSNFFGYLLFGICLFLFVSPIEAAMPVKNALTLAPADRALVTKIQDKLNAITTLQAEFIQDSKKAGGSKQTSRGMFLLSRIKGESVKFRFEYAPPPRVMIIGTGNNIMYFDNDMDQKTPLDLRQTPAAFLAKPNISFTDDYNITQLKKGPKEIEIRVIQRKDPQAGSVDVRFKTQDLSLIGWRLVDMQATETSLQLSSVIQGLKLDKNLFKILSPETGGKPKSLYEK